MKRKKPSRDAFEAWLAHLEVNERRMHEINQRNVESHNANLPSGAEPWPDRVPPPGRNSTRAERAAWNAQLRWDVRLLRELAEKDRTKPESDAA